jgi:hypothetical protein
MSIARLCLLTVLLGLIALLPSAWSQGTYAQAPDVRTQDWTQTTTVDFAGGEMSGLVISDLAGGELRLAPDATTGIYTSIVGAAAFVFNTVAPHWRAAVPDSTALWVELRVHTTDGGWSPWYPFDEVEREASERQFFPETPLLILNGQQFQYRVTLTTDVAGQSPILDEMTVTAIDATAGPTTSQAKAAIRPGDVTAQGVPQPAIISRAGWGADEGLMTWPPEYCTIEKIVVHHTVSTNNYTEDQAAGLVRGIYYYHAVTRGWGDIGYNYLVDKYGNIYEGRYGGPGVVGGHVYGYNYGSMGIGTIGSHGNTSTSVPPTTEALAGLRDLAAWEADRSDIHPLESDPFYDTATPNLAGHRDYPPGTTACPGDYLYAKLPDLRQAVWERIISYKDKYHVDWLSWNTPPHTVLADETYSLTIGVRNAGWFTWTQAGVTNSVRLGYRWYDDGGQQAVQPPEDDHRGPLDYDLTFDKTYTFEPALVTTPITPGVYTLAWDMVHEGVNWFHDANDDSPLLTMTLTITDTLPVTVTGRLLDVRGGAVSGGQVALPDWITVTAATDGSYALPRLARSTYTLTASADGYAAQLPAYGVDATSSDVIYPFILVPDGFPNLLANGDFEDGLSDWSSGGITASPPVSTAAAHTGLGAAQLGGSPFSGTVWLSQTVELPANTLSPTLSLLYRLPATGDGATFKVTLASQTAEVIHTLPLTAAGWTHFWSDLPAGWDGPVDLQLKLTQSGSPTPTAVLVDEVVLGHQGAVSYTNYLPLVLRAYAPSECTERIANGGFEETAAWEILNTVYPAGYSTDQAHGGSRALRAGIKVGDEDIFSYSSAQQTLTLPATTGSAVLTYWWHPTSTDADDVQYLLLLDQDSAILDSLLWASANDQTWLSAQADLTEYAGLTLTLRFGVYNDGDGGVTRMYVDDVSLQACSAP